MALERVRMADSVPLAVIHTWLPAPSFSKLTAEALRNASHHAVLGEKFGVRITVRSALIRWSLELRLSGGKGRRCTVMA
ncbi:DNA-binding GntR family transcriptional regulator [Arthrobacter sp. CAN_A214]